MSNTRRATAGSPAHQERFCSSPELSRGLLAKIVAERCTLLDDPADRQLVWFLQWLSHRRGLDKVAAEIVFCFARHIGTRSMHRFGLVGKYDAAQVRSIRREMPGEHREGFRLGTEDYSEMVAGSPCQDGKVWELPEEESATTKIERDMCWNSMCENDHTEDWPKRERPVHPESYSAERFNAVCLEAAKSVAAWLTRICLDPGCPPSKCEPWFWPDLVPCLRAYLAGLVQSRRDEMVITEIGRRVHNSLNYSLKFKCLVLIEGRPRTGKTFAAKDWCDLHPGEARYVQVPSTGDDIGFFRKIAESIGSASALSMKGVQLRERVEGALQTSKIMLVMDEAHYLLPQANRREALPGRINWLMTALVNYNVPVALVTTPQFTKDREIVEKKTGWTSAQFLGRIGHYESLPETVTDDDLEAIARQLLPDADSKSIKMLALYGKATKRYLSAIEAAVTRARFLASEAGREAVKLADVNRATDEAVPGDKALIVAKERNRMAPVEWTN